MPDLCAKCEKPLSGAMISDDDGWKHPQCYYRDHPYKPKTTFKAVLQNCDDQALAHRLIREILRRKKRLRAYASTAMLKQGPRFRR